MIVFSQLRKIWDSSDIFSKVSSLVNRLTQTAKEYIRQAIGWTNNSANNLSGRLKIITPSQKITLQRDEKLQLWNSIKDKKYDFQSHVCLHDSQTLENEVLPFIILNRQNNSQLNHLLLMKWELSQAAHHQKLDFVIIKNDADSNSGRRAIKYDKVAKHALSLDPIHGLKQEQNGKNSVDRYTNPISFGHEEITISGASFNTKTDDYAFYSISMNGKSKTFVLETNEALDLTNPMTIEELFTSLESKNIDISKLKNELIPQYGDL